MLDVQPIIGLLNSRDFRGRVQSGAVHLAAPINPDELRDVESQVPADLLDALLPLLRVTSGFDLYAKPSAKGADRDAPILSIDLRRLRPQVWDTAYPIAAEIGVYEEFLYWDLLGEPVGQVFLVDHDGPLHCLAFNSLQDALAFFVTRDAAEVWRELTSLPRERANWPTVGEFRTENAELLAFLGQFPSQYTVHDLRDAGLRDAYSYNASGPAGIARWGAKRVFVQRQPRNWLEAMKWWWNPNVARA